jgi:atypical dual specificity phosphatase
MRRRNSVDEPSILAPVIEGRLFVGSQVEASDLDLLQRAGVQCVLNCAREIPCFHKSVLVYHHLVLEDDENEILEPLFEQAFEFIDSGVCLVHCQAGISRSVTFVLAYLMARKNLTLCEAFQLVKGVRPCAGPNIGYWRQLMALEESITKMPCTFSLQDYYVETLASMGFNRSHASDAMQLHENFDLALGHLLRGQ